MTEHEFEELTIVGVLEAPRTGRERGGSGKPPSHSPGGVMRLVERIRVFVSLWSSKLAP